MKKLMIVALLCVGGVHLMTAQQGTVTTAVPFLMITPNSQSGALGDAGVATAEDAWAVYWNPAGLAFQTGSEVALSRADWLPAFNLGDLWIAHAAFKMPLEELDGTVGAGLTYMNLGKFERTQDSPTPIGEFTGYELALVLSYATKISPTLGVGVNVRLIRDQLSPLGAGVEAGNGVATDFSFDLGIMYRPQSLDFLSLGANLSNIGPKVTYVDKDQADPLPMNLRFGAAAKLLVSDFNNITWLVDFNRLLVKRDTAGHTDEFYKAIFSTWSGSSFSDQMRHFTFSTGVEYWYGQPRLLALRAGYFWEDPSAGNRRYMTFGAGLKWESFGFDFSYISTFEDQHPLGNTLRLSISIGWGGGN